MELKNYYLTSFGYNSEGKNLNYRNKVGKFMFDESTFITWK